ncbi:MAG: sialate O-acetylesterase, partial [Clostridiales bacterium]|nr:sialate O-acetylesterase [Clostridiales bacterium]
MKKILTKLLMLVMCFALIVGGFAIMGNATVSVVSANETQEKQTEKIADVYLIAGQSNAVGSTLIANGAGPVYQQQNNNSFANPEIKYDNVLYNHHAHPTTKGSGYMITNFVPVTQGLGYTQAKNHIGPELGMAEYLDPIYAQKENTDAIIVKVAAGGTTLTRHYDDANLDIEALREVNSYDANFGTWYPESLWNVTNGGLTVDLWDGQYYRHPTGLLYRELISFVKLNYQWLQDEGYTKINFKALCWMQGESDRGQVTEYKVAFNAFMNDVRRHLSELTGEDYSNFPVVCGEISKTFSSAASQPTNEKFISMQHEIAYNLNQTYVIPTKDFLIHDFNEFGADVTLGSDGAHWNYPDMLDIGYLFGEKAYNVNPDDKWVYFNSTAKRNDHMDKTSLENVKFDIDEFNKNGKLSFTCDLKKLYNITSLKIKDGMDLMPYLTQTVSGNIRKYELKDVPVDNSKDITLESHFTNADAYNVSVSIAQEGNGYGDKIYTYENKVYANAGYYELEAHPAQDGRVYKVTINDIEVEGAKNNATIVLDDIFDYLNGQSEFKIVVQYSPIPPLRIEASGYIGTFEVGEQFSTDGLVVKFLDQLDNETVLSANDYTVDSS